MARQDSGNETMMSDTSPHSNRDTPPQPPCLVPVSPTHEAGPRNNGGSSDHSVFPPKITPFSGVLDKGKIVVRPIAFKPVGLSSGGRFSNNGERYGSTPILARPGSHLTLYGSTSDLRHHHHNYNYSLDRKSLSSSSPPLAMASLSSLPLNHSSSKLHGCESFDNMRHCKSPASTSGSVISSKMKTSSFRLISNADSSSSLLDLTPSPSDSGVAELEAALRERDSEVVYLRQTMEHNEQAIIRVYQEKERAWDREKRKLKSGHETRVRNLGQKILQLEQMLLMQSYQAQQDKQQCSEVVESASRESAELRQEVHLLRGRLEETEWTLCQKTGELSLLKTQLKESHCDQSSKGHELVQLRNHLKELKAEQEKRKEVEEAQAKEKVSRENELSKLRVENERLCSELNKKTRRDEEEAIEIDKLKAEVVTLRREIEDVCQVLKEEQDEKSKLTGELEKLKNKNEKPIALFNKRWAGEWSKEEDCLKSDFEDLRVTTAGDTTTDDAKYFRRELDKVKDQLISERTDFEQERITWAQEKEKVLRYQRQLQLNYVQMFRRSRTLEAEVESLTMELELENRSKGFRAPKPPPAIEMSATIDL